jgi:hypothetical protein
MFSNEDLKILLNLISPKNFLQIQQKEENIAL